MATLQKIRSKGALLLIVIGLAMFAFIAEELVRSISSSTNENRMHVGEINGESINQNDFQTLVNGFTDVLKMTGQIPEQDNSETTARIREQMWQQCVEQKVVGDECDKLGLTVTDKEVQAVIEKGQHPMLQSWAPQVFKNQQGMFDVNQLRQFMKQRDEMLSSGQITSEQRDMIERINNCWLFIEKQLKLALLEQKYQGLLSGLMISNTVEAKATFDDRTSETNVVLAGIPYSQLKDEDFKPTDEELQAKYNEMKERFINPQEQREAKYIDVAIVASQADKKALNDEMVGYDKQLADSGDAAAVVSQSTSLCPYLPFAVAKTALPIDVQNRVDSLGVGQKTGIYYNAADNTTNDVKLLSRHQVADSIQYRVIGVGDPDAAKMKARADSIFAALQAGAPFDTLAARYNQPGTEQWLTGQMYEGQANVDETNQKFIQTLLDGEKGKLYRVDGEQGIAIVEVMDKRDMKDKYDVAIIKRTVDFSPETENKTFNDFSTYVAAHPTIADMEGKGADARYTVRDVTLRSSSETTVGDVQNSREAVQWLFNDKRKVGDVSEINPYGDGNDHLLVVALTAIHEKGYLTLDVEWVKEAVSQEVIRDKKAEKLIAQMKGKTSVQAVAALPGAVTDNVNHVTFSAPVTLQKMMAQEFVLSGAISGAAQGKFIAGVKGQSGVYAFQVVKKYKTQEKYEQQNEMAQLAMYYGQNIASSKMQELLLGADIEDFRYRFF